MTQPDRQSDKPTAPRPPASERLQTVRTLVIGVVIMWVVLVGGWATSQGIDALAAAKTERDVRNARERLASVGDLAEIFNEVSTAVEPAVVKIDVRRRPDYRGRRGQAAPESNSGSGVIVETQEDDAVGYIVTNEHVVDGAMQILVTLNDGRTAPARVIGTDLPSDIAVLRIRSERLIAAEWGDSDSLRKGDWVVAFGSPFGFVGSMTAGIVSALNRERDTAGFLGDRVPYTDYIQTDAAINPGNSGGPLTNVQGQVIGINTAIFTLTGDFAGIGFAIPSNQTRRIYDDIRQRGRAIRGWLGAELGDFDDNLAASYQSEYDGSGVVVTQVYRDTPADRGGLLIGDIITGVDGTDVDAARAVRNRIAFAKPGTQVDLTVFREGGTVNVPVIVDEQPAGDIRMSLPPVGGAAHGLTLVDGRQRTQRGSRPRVIVEEVRADSPAADAGIAPGDFVLAVNGIRVDTAGEADSLLRRRGIDLGLKIRIERRGRAIDVIVRDE
ncbi:MAG: trypsin-like peptidase domain-containing protein [Planctomycetota bacterium]